MEHFHPQKIEMSTTEHLALQKFEPIHMSFERSITPRQRASITYSGIVSTNPVHKAGEFRHVTLFRSLEPSVQHLNLTFFEQRHKFLAQQVDGAEFLMEVHVLNLLLLHPG